MDHHSDAHDAAAAHGEHASHVAHAADTPGGVSSSAKGFLLSQIEAPRVPGEPGALRFRIEDGDGRALVDYTTVHQQDLHLIVVRSDGTRFRHVHPQLDRETGWWSVDWEWEAAGTYRVFADFSPAGATSMHDGVTLTRMVDVSGDAEHVFDRPVAFEAEVDGFHARLNGVLRSDTAGSLAIEISRDGLPVTNLQPYLGAFGHLVALRSGDLAYLHVHPEGGEPAEADLSGPVVTFMAQAPSAGRYFLFFDFKVDDQVRTAAFVVEVARGEAG